LKEFGYVEGENVAIDYRFAQNQVNRLPELTAELIGLRAAVITSMDNASTAVAKTATAAIPIVFNVGGDPVRLGLVASLARPGGNLTGINFFLNELVAKRLELLRELVPTATRVAVLVNPANAEVTESTLRDVEAAWGCKSRSSRLTPVRKSMLPSKVWYASGPTPFLLPPVPSSPLDECNSRN
jgi:putative ABC transport system substrate-binding protein